ncbi:MAG: HAD-IA family hydrolase [Thermofilum sp.]|jgi:putative hydrolase of the HAD superfamily|nr:HAD-IA family hydrolase [Thermofilum sp.]
MGSTLVFDRGFAGHLARNICEALEQATGRKFTSQEVLSAWNKTSVHGDDVETWDLVRSMFLLRFLGITPRPELVDLTYRAVLRSYVEGFELDSNARDALRKVKELGFTVGVITNVGSYEIVRTRLAEAGLVEYVDVLIASQAVVWRKPHRKIFEWACFLAGVEPHQAVHVGDDPRADIEGAKSAGLRAIQVLRDASSKSPAADAWVHSVGEVPRVLEEWVSKGYLR